LEKNTTAVGGELTVCCERHRGDGAARTISGMWRYSESWRHRNSRKCRVTVVVWKTEWVGCLHRLGGTNLPYRQGKTWTTERIPEKLQWTHLL